MNLLHEMEKERREAEVLERMKRQSKQEEELTLTVYRILRLAVSFITQSRLF